MIPIALARALPVIALLELLRFFFPAPFVMPVHLAHREVWVTNVVVKWHTNEIEQVFSRTILPTPPQAIFTHPIGIPEGRYQTNLMIWADMTNTALRDSVASVPNTIFIRQPMWTNGIVIRRGDTITNVYSWEN
jgi:hypothetical protein